MHGKFASRAHDDASGRFHFEVFQKAFYYVYAIRFLVDLIFILIL